MLLVQSGPRRCYHLKLDPLRRICILTFPFKNGKIACQGQGATQGHTSMLYAYFFTSDEIHSICGCADPHPIGDCDLGSHSEADATNALLGPVT